MEPTQSQLDRFAEFHRHPEIDVTSAEFIGRRIFVTFEYQDPRPSRNGLVDASFAGHVALGPNGSARGEVHCFGFGSIDYKIRRGRDLSHALHCAHKTTDAERHTIHERGKRAKAWLAANA